MSLQAQRYRQRIAIDAPVQTRDLTTGGFTIGWEELYASLPAEVLLGPGREFDAASARQAETTARINLHWFPGLLPTMRVRWDGRIFDTQEISADATNRREYRLRCTDGVQVYPESAPQPLEFAANGQPLNLQPDGNSMEFA